MRQRMRAWPFLVAIVCLIYDTKWVLLILLWMDVGPAMLYGIPMVTAVVELLYWNWFMGWFPHWAKDQEAARSAFEDFWGKEDEDDGFRQPTLKLFRNARRLGKRVWDWGLHRWNEMFNSDGRYKRWLGRFAIWFFKVMPRLFAYPFIAFLGIWPGGFLLAIPLCKTHKIPLGLTTLLSASAFTNWLMAKTGKSALEWLFAYFGS